MSIKIDEYIVKIRKIFEEAKEEVNLLKDEENLKNENINAITQWNIRISQLKEKATDLLLSHDVNPNEFKDFYEYEN